MLRFRFGFGLLWVAFLGYAIAIAPPDQPETLDLIVNLSTGAWDGINPLILALFNLMGIWPFIYLMFLYSDGRGQRLPAALFAVGGFVGGAFAILPYLALRRPNPSFSGPVGWWLRLHDSRWLGVGLLAGSVALVVWGITAGDWGDFVTQWQTSRFIHVMSLDFLMLSGLITALLGDDMARRGLENRAVFWAVALVPLFGPLLYVCWRPALQDQPMVEPETAIA
ncbi:hypothetical protein PN441_03355 [Spirulina major CS-329]|uniref:hypothetical protein n=1 Tax=Spirulina TaxID=1154 RepID=UPI00232C9FC6|nr:MULTISPECIES: hypothetical protein [Spirulina]MDB9496517.1 hypothetical protein [Spirulina subsalsa CS-330]MDB9502095.1 hypothetical protein [Spirulina major CS-329]